MPAVSAPNAAIIRYPSHALLNAYLCIMPKVVVGTALVNGTPTWTSVVADITVDNTSADWLDTQRGMLVEITRAGVLIYQGICRRPPTATLIRISAIREGDTGTAQLFAQSITDNDTVTVYSTSIPWSNLSYLDDAGDLYKRFDVAFNTSYPQSRYFEPHGRIGTHRHVRVAEGSDAALTFTDNSVDYSANGSLTRTWLIPDTWAFTGGSVDTDATITVDAPAGNHILQMLAERVSGVEETDTSLAKRFVFVTDGPDGDNPAFSDLFRITAVESVQDRTGRTDTYTVQCAAADESTLLSYLYPGAFCLFQEDAGFSADQWASYEQPTAGLVNEFCGHLRRYEMVSEDPDGTQTWRLTFMSWTHYCTSLVIPSQVMRASDSPTQWYHVYRANMNVAAWMFIILFYHTEIPRWYDLYLENVDDFSLYGARFDATSLYDSLVQLAAYVLGANVGCISNGAFYARRHGSFESDATRDAIATVWTWAAGDLLPSLAHARDPIMKVGKLSGAAAVSSTSDTPALHRAQAAYRAQTQGLNSDTVQGFIGLNESDIYARLGHAFQNRNRPIDRLPAAIFGNRDVIDPALMEWHKLDVATRIPLSSEAFGTTRRWLPLSVTRIYEFTPFGIVKRITAEFEPETKGKPAHEIPAVALGTILTPLDPPSGAWCWEDDFLTSAGDWYAGNSTTTYHASTGWGPTAGGVGPMDIRLDIAGTGVINEMTFVISQAVVPGYLRIFVGSTEIAEDNGSGTTTFTLSGFTINTPVTVRIVATNNQIAGMDANFRIRNITQEGTGDNPIGSDNCA